MANDKKKNMVVASLAIGAIVLTGVGLGYYFYGGTTPPPPPSDQDPTAGFTDQERQEFQKEQEQREQMIKRSRPAGA
ncbi:MAG: hypothetical protein KF864_02935 [Phycisphaeraceae bacterium]|nr:hypothetical protein [Phycisphaeraceae bacterium]MBX3410448.1 hypothetical protein [Phycisphaeraceae bacterium]